jgi:hypothetical protein
MKKQMRYSPEVRERAVRLLREHQGDYASEWAVLWSGQVKPNTSVKQRSSLLQPQLHIDLDFW